MDTANIDIVAAEHSEVVVAYNRTIVIHRYVQKSQNFIKKVQISSQLDERCGKMSLESILAIWKPKIPMGYPTWRLGDHAL